MRKRIASFFEFQSRGTTIRREFVAGLTTFVTMSYIIAVNPAILKARNSRRRLDDRDDRDRNIRHSADGADR